jgi:hypothetical protein
MTRITQKALNQHVQDWVSSLVLPDMPEYKKPAFLEVRPSYGYYHLSLFGQPLTGNMRPRELFDYLTSPVWDYITSEIWRTALDRLRANYDLLMEPAVGYTTLTLHAQPNKSGIEVRAEYDGKMFRVTVDIQNGSISVQSVVQGTRASYVTPYLKLSS